MTNEEIARATGLKLIGVRSGAEVEAIILAAINRAQSEDKARANFLLNLGAELLAQETLEDDAEFEAWWQKFRNHSDMAGETKSDCKLAWKAARKRLGIHKTK